jgi:hypothetical protein
MRAPKRLSPSQGTRRIYLKRKPQNNLLPPRRIQFHSEHPRGRTPKPPIYLYLVGAIELFRFRGEKRSFDFLLQEQQYGDVG